MFSKTDSTFTPRFKFFVNLPTCPPALLHTWVTNFESMTQSLSVENENLWTMRLHGLHIQNFQSASNLITFFYKKVNFLEERLGTLETEQDELNEKICELESQVKNLEAQIAAVKKEEKQNLFERKRKQNTENDDGIPKIPKNEDDASKSDE
uniref:Uncharacterized protein n=1 Tax=Panagrolaimus sp. JU765 TaxID=591449 RepID=A0AC34R615_9BILA